MTYITAKEMHDAAKQKYACKEALDWLASLLEEANPLEHEHLKKLEWIYWYAYNVIQDRWPEAEAMIATEPEHACLYARDVVQGRWPEAEATIATDSVFWKLYQEHCNLS